MIMKLNDHDKNPEKVNKLCSFNLSSQESTIFFDNPNQK